jgi:hypothetical protein
MVDSNKRTPVCRHCKGNGYTGGIQPAEPELSDACEVCLGSGRTRRGFLHARTFETRWGLGLAFIDLDIDEDRELLSLQVWAPLATDGSDCAVRINLGLPGSASTAAHEIFAEANREALEAMDADKFEAGFDRAGIGAALDEAFAKQEAE